MQASLSQVKNSKILNPKIKKKFKYFHYNNKSEKNLVYFESRTLINNLRSEKSIEIEQKNFGSQKWKEIPFSQNSSQVEKIVEPEFMVNKMESLSLRIQFKKKFEKYEIRSFSIEKPKTQVST